MMLFMAWLLRLMRNKKVSLGDVIHLDFKDIISAKDRRISGDQDSVLQRGSTIHIDWYCRTHGVSTNSLFAVLSNSQAAHC